MIDTRIVAGSLVLFGAVMTARAQDAGQDWPNWRGPSYDGISTETGWRTDWSASPPKVLWKADVGVGASSVAVVGDRVYTMGNQGNQDVVWCLDATTGQTVWKRTYDCPLDKRQFEGGTAATPTVADGKVYTLSHRGDLKCWDAADGKPIWSVNLVDAFGGKRPRWGYAGSPLVLDEKVIVDTGSPRASTVALHKDTGRPIWTSGNQMGAYAAPVVMTIDGRQTVLCFKATELVGIDPSNGRQLWAFEWKTSYDVHATPPMVFDGDKIFLSTGYNRGCTLLRIDRGRPVVLWENRDLSTQVNPAVVYEGHVYGITGNAGRGDLVCMRLSDGEVMWEQGGFGTGALMIADGYLVVTSERGGKLAVAPASPKGFNATGEMTGLYDGRSWVAPVLSHRKIFAKDNAGSLACVDVSE